VADPVAAVSRERAGQALAREHEPAQRLEVGRQPGERPAVGSGVHASVAEAVAAFVAYQPDEHLPDPERHQAYSQAYRRYRDCYYALKPVFEGQAG